MKYEKRIQILQNQLSKKKITAAILSSPSAIRYLCGFTGSSGLFVVTRSSAFLIADFRYQTQAAQEVDQAVSVIIAHSRLWKTAITRVKKYTKGKRLGIETEQVHFALAQKLQSQYPELALVAIDGVIRDQRQIKDSNEIELLTAAAAIADRCFEYAFSLMRVGISERQLARKIEEKAYELGAEGLSFPMIVASGPNSALPHAQPTDRLLQAGDLITLDMGVIIQGYCSDCTRTIALAAATDEQKRIYGLVWRAQQQAIKNVKAGVVARQVDVSARTLLAKAGYAKQFGHALGHGVGLEIHEAPTLAPRSRDLLEEGMVVTVEPGVYLPGWGGVRIEDMLLVGQKHSSLLTKVYNPPELLIVS